MPSRKTSDATFSDLSQNIDLDQFKESIKSSFADFPDPRNDRIIYPVWYLFLIILSGYLSGCNTIADLAHFAELRKGWFADLTGKNLSAPSYDTIWWFLVRVNPETFKALISRWLQGLPRELKDNLLAIDGKRLNGISSNEHICHLVELFAVENRMVIAQEKVPDKAGESKALPLLLDSIDIRGAIVSMDALYANVNALNEILKRGADYIVGIKGNQGYLENGVRNFFERIKDAQYDNVDEITREEIQEAGHGRIERRSICVATSLEWLPQREKWNLQSLIEVRSERTIKGKTEQAIRYYGSSRKATAKQFSKWIREHWGIENSLHYVMDVVFQEDASLADVGYSAENMALIRRLANNIIKTFDSKRGITDARRNATYEPNYLRGLLGKMFVK